MVELTHCSYFFLSIECKKFKQNCVGFFFFDAQSFFSIVPTYNVFES